MLSADDRTPTRIPVGAIGIEPIVDWFTASPGTLPLLLPCPSGAHVHPVGAIQFVLGGIVEPFSGSRRSWTVTVLHPLGNALPLGAVHVGECYSVGLLTEPFNRGASMSVARHHCWCGTHLCLRPGAVGELSGPQVFACALGLRATTRNLCTYYVTGLGKNVQYIPYFSLPCHAAHFSS